jgi:hypothetical protein
LNVPLQRAEQEVRASSEETSPQMIRSWFVSLLIGTLVGTIIAVASMIVLWRRRRMSSREVELGVAPTTPFLQIN